MDAMAIIMDGRTYRVRTVYTTLMRSWELIEGPNAGDMLSGRHERDLIGTRYTYSMQVQPDPRYQTDYDALVDALTDPVDYHTVTLPYGQGTVTYQAMILSGQDTYMGQLAGQCRWGALQVLFKAIAPNKEPTP